MIAESLSADAVPVIEEMRSARPGSTPIAGRKRGGSDASGSSSSLNPPVALDFPEHPFTPIGKSNDHRAS